MGRFAIIIRSTAATETGQLPPAEFLQAFNAYNKTLAEAGILVGGEMLHPSATAARLTFSEGGASTLSQGPFPSNEVVAGFLAIKADSKEEAIQIAQKAPMRPGVEVEIRQVSAPEDLAGAGLPESILKEQLAVRKKAAENANALLAQYS
jgi:hypothetical protein